MVGDEARAFWIAAPGRGEIRRETLTAPAADEVVVRTLFSGVSRGTEALVFQGRVPVSEHDRMRAPFQEGAFPAPVKYGYASVGTIERGLNGAELLYELDGTFVTDSGGTGYVVDGIAAQGHHVHHALGRDAEDFFHLDSVGDQIVFRRVEYEDLVGDELQHVLVAGNDVDEV